MRALSFVPPYGAFDELIEADCLIRKTKEITLFISRAVIL